MKAVYNRGRGGNEFARLLPLCASVVAGLLTAPNASDSGEPPAQPPAEPPSQAVAQSPPLEAATQSTITADKPPDPASSGKPDTGAQPAGMASPGAAQSVANKPGRKVLVDDTVTDAQLKQILGKGYEPQRQARGNEVYYCRSEHELGSRFETKVCKTAARILQEEQQGKEATTNVEKTDGNRPLK
jgi:hypothetical protein